MLFIVTMKAACWPLAVLLVSAALGLDFEHELSLSRRENPVFLLRRQKWNKEKRVKRSEEFVGESCYSLQHYGAKLQEDTHTRVFNDVSGSVSLAWVGDGTGVLLVLTTYQMPLFMFRFSEPKLYRSEDHGKTFQDITDLLNNTFIMTHFGIAFSPDNSGKVILTGNLSEGKGSRILCSLDFGKSFTSSDLPFQVLMQITYNPENNSVLAVISTLSRPFGVALLFGGVDEKGPQLYHMDPSGTFVQCDARAIGSASEGAQSSLQEVYHKSMTLKEAIKSSLTILKQVMEEKLNATNIELATIEPNKTFHMYTKEELEDVIKDI